MNTRLPSIENGYLPYWLLLLSVVSIGNSIQSFTTIKYTREIYAATTVTHLQARTFGTWTAVASIVRIVAAYNVHDPPVYLLAFATYVIAGFHFWSELLIFRTSRVNRATIGPLVVATVSLVWMWQQWDNYVKA